MNDYPELLNSTHALARELQGLQAMRRATTGHYVNSSRRLGKAQRAQQPVAMLGTLRFAQPTFLRLDLG
ncbi:MAG: hypothetical protein Q8O33_09375 [Pseudomonadota bacterium]|nr:hypothetical protein [Pseudomonadota bacterium]